MGQLSCRFLLASFAILFAQISVAEPVVVDGEVNSDYVVDAKLSLEEQLEYEDTLAGAQFQEEEVKRIQQRYEEQKQYNEKIREKLVREVEEARERTVELKREIRHFRNLERIEQEKKVKMEVQREQNRTQLQRVEAEAAITRSNYEQAAADHKEMQKLANDTKKAILTSKTNLEEVKKVIAMINTETMKLKKEVLAGSNEMQAILPQLREANQIANTEIAGGEKALQGYNTNIEDLKTTMVSVNQNNQVLKKYLKAKQADLVKQNAQIAKIRTKPKVLKKTVVKKCEMHGKPNLQSKVIRQARLGSKMLISPINKKWMKTYSKKGKTGGYLLASCF